MNKYLLLLSILLLLPVLVFSQTNRYQISGTIVDSQTMDPLPGANISFQNTTIGTSSDSNGDFEFTANLAPGNFRILFSFIGYSRKVQQITLEDNLNIDLGVIELNLDIIGADEVVITGASALTSKRQIGNAISTVSAEDLSLSGASSLDRALSGKISGALVQQNSGNPAGGISIRLRGTGSLLGSADPLYIVDGMIMNNDSPQLVTLGGYSQNRLVDLNPNDIDRIEVVKGAAAAALYGSRANNGVVQIFTKRGQSGEPRVTYSSKVNIDRVRNTLKVNETPFNAAGNPVDRFDAQDDIFRTAAGTEQFLSVTGGQNTTRYYVSGSYLNNEGVINNTDFQRATARLNLDQDLNDWATVSFGFNYSYSESQEIPNGGLNDNYGALTGFIFGPNTIDPRPDPETGVYPGGFILANPLEVIDRYDINQTVNRINGNTKLTLMPYEGLSLDYTLGIDTYSQVATFFIPVGTTAPGLGQGFSRRAEREFLQLNNDLNIRYQTFLSRNLESTTLVGGTMQFEEFSTIGLESREFSPFIQVVTGGGNFAQPGESRAERVIYGAFAQQTFGFQDKLFVTAAGRFDAASSFGRDERWQFYPKISASYVLSEENFWQDTFSDVITSFKLRASLGTSGGLTAIGPFDRFTRFSPTSVDGRSALIPSSQQGALDIKPERQKELELGVDATFLNDRISLEFSWYDQQTDDLLLTRSIAPSTGSLSRIGNFGTLENKGIELMVRAVPVNTSNLQWTTSFTYSRNKNKIDGIENDFLILGSSFGQSAAKNGEALGVFYSSFFERDANGEIVLDANELPIRGDGSKVIGDPNPDFTGAFINSVQVGSNWNFRMQWDFVYGNDVFNFTRRLAALSVFGTLDDPYGQELRGELPEGYSARVFGIFENWVEDGSYLKLRELSVSYTAFPEFLGLRSLQFSLVGRNLLSIDNYSGYDPELNTAGQLTAVRGFDFVEVPIPRSIQFGITANF
jgi:TonB-dependent starch-binding outer membrane protein SusC